MFLYLLIELDVNPFFFPVPWDKTFYTTNFLGGSKKITDVANFF